MLYTTDNVNKVSNLPSTSHGSAFADTGARGKPSDDVNNIVPNMLFYGNKVKSEPISEPLDNNLSEFSSFLRKYDSTTMTSNRNDVKPQRKSTPVKAKKM